VNIHARGHCFSAERDEALGSPQQPLERGAVERKFASLVDDVIGNGARETLIEQIWRADRQTTVRDLLSATAPATN
jgi:hypothetical protein